MSEKTFKIVGEDMSDGYHTFDELYEHRCLLFLLWAKESKREVFYVEDHFPGWDLVATNVGRKQISYHIPEKYRDISSRFIKRDSVSMEAMFDGHTSKDVAERIAEYLREK